LPVIGKSDDQTAKRPLLTTAPNAANPAPASNKGSVAPTPPNSANPTATTAAPNGSET